MEFNDIEILGRKTFFIAPDTSLLPDTYLEQFLAHGFECYHIGDDGVGSMRDKVSAILSLYPSCILFFNIDAVLDGIDDWRAYVRSIMRENGDRVLVGVMFAKKAVDKERKLLENQYERELGVQCGCISLERHSKETFEKIDRILTEKKANGRRKTARALCDMTSEVHFEYGFRKCSAKAVDLSVTHFSCVLEEANCDIPIYEKFKDVNLFINGMHFTSDAVLIMKRTKGDQNMCVFMFVQRDGSTEMDVELLAKLNRKVYQMVSGAGKLELRQAFGRLGLGA